MTILSIKKLINWNLMQQALLKYVVFETLGNKMC